MSDPTDRLSAPERAGASVLHEALEMRQAVERELAEAAEVRTAALTEATQLLEQARLAAAGEQEEAREEARRTIEQAREQALGIVAQAREEASQLLADAHADAAEFEAWARREAQADIHRDLADIRQKVAERRHEVGSGLEALREATERTMAALEGSARLAAALDDATPGADVPAGGPATGPLADLLRSPENTADRRPPRGPVISLVPPPADHDPDDPDDHAGTDDLDREVEPAEGIVVEVEDYSFLDDLADLEELAGGGPLEVADAEPDDAELDMPDGPDGPGGAGGPGPGDPVVPDDGEPSYDDGPGAVADVPDVPDVPDVGDAADDGSRPLGWLFRSPSSSSS
ncbi:ATP synthase F0 subunit B [Nocardioides litoris]|uniref:ATP synthase F0 subunit B n=1 Tax=Nocardioides litoris TaxID=1926648 RepID=UPI0011228349|nr:ATP synthase F0 subunit B [Nocardioides litoris]